LEFIFYFTKFQTMSKARHFGTKKYSQLKLTQRTFPIDYEMEKIIQSNIIFDLYLKKKK